MVLQVCLRRGLTPPCATPAQDGAELPGAAPILCPCQMCGSGPQDPRGGQTDPAGPARGWRCGAGFRSHRNQLPGKGFMGSLIWFFSSWNKVVPGDLIPACQRRGQLLPEAMPARRLITSTFSPGQEAPKGPGVSHGAPGNDGCVPPGAWGPQPPSPGPHVPTGCLSCRRGTGCLQPGQVGGQGCGGGRSPPLII